MRPSRLAVWKRSSPLQAQEKGEGATKGDPLLDEDEVDLSLLLRAEGLERRGDPLWVFDGVAADLP
ncbi:MAG: hypothetical protein KAI47_09505 [Deltaproteobacteria bacterium]|nr:hypothetical protein [Deltaproteobacteria bacterium]